MTCTVKHQVFHKNDKTIKFRSSFLNFPDFCGKTCRFLSSYSSFFLCQVVKTQKLVLLEQRVFHRPTVESVSNFPLHRTFPPRIRAGMQSFPQFCRVFHSRTVENSVFSHFGRFAQNEIKKQQRKKREKSR